MPIKHRCIRCDKLVKWYEKILVDEDTYRVPSEDNKEFTIYSRKKVIHWKCLTKQEQKKVIEAKRKKKKDDEDTTNLDQIRY